MLASWLFDYFAHIIAWLIVVLLISLQLSSHLWAEMALNVNDLEGTHVAHDTFVRSYLNQIAQNDVVAPVLNASLNEMNLEKPLLVAFINGLIDNPGNRRPHVHRLALYIMLRQFPELWEFMFTPTYELLCSILDIIRTTNVDIYPPKWTEKVFRLESIISPNNLRGVMFGIDPISYGTQPYSAFATGHAFTFDVPLGIVLDDASSTVGLMTSYGLTRSVTLNRSTTLETYFIQTHRIGMVNFIRTIKAGSLAGSGNGFKNAWSAYNLAWLQGLPQVANSVLIFQNEHYIFDNYCTTPHFQQVRALLVAAPRCSHPSYIRAREDHCLRVPDCFYPTARGIAIPDQRSNDSVHAFVAYLQQLQADESFRCLCAQCITLETDELLQDFLNMML